MPPSSIAEAVSLTLVHLDNLSVCYTEREHAGSESFAVSRRAKDEIHSGLNSHLRQPSFGISAPRSCVDQDVVQLQ